MYLFRRVITFKMFERTQSYRVRLDEAKKSLEDFRNILNNKAVFQDNHFVKPIFNGYDTLISMHECVRRGVKPITQSLQMTTYSPDFAQFIIESVPNDLESVAHLIGTLYYQGSHSYVRPDELAFLRHFKSGEFETGRCLCGDCRRYEENFISTTAHIISSFNPQNQDGGARFPQPDNRRLRSNSYDSTEDLLEEMGDEIVIPENVAPIASRNIFYQRENSGFIVRLPAENYQQSQNSWPDGFVDIQISDSLFEELDLYFADELNESFLEPVPVVMDNASYNNCVDISTSNEDYNCPICLEIMSNKVLCLNELCVATKCCGKVFHDKCLRHLLVNVGPPKCPLCRTDLRDEARSPDHSSDSDSAEISEIFQ